MASAIDSGILISSDVLDDLEHLRIAAQHRERILREKKGVTGQPLEMLQEILSHLQTLESEAERELRNWMSQHELEPFVKGTIGLGDKQTARLLAQIGSPCLRYDPETGEEIQRTVRQLWAYCGYAPGQRPTAGQRLGYNPHAKKRVRMIAEQAIRHRCEACVEQGRAMKEVDEAGWHPPAPDCTCRIKHPYRVVFDTTRAQYDSYDTTDLHKHNMALRRVCKEILKDLWREAARLRPIASRATEPDLVASKPEAVTA